MSDLLVSLLELIVISFIGIMVFDFVDGLVHLARSVQSQSKVQIEPEAITLEAITPMTEPLSPLGLPDPWTLPSEVPTISQGLAPAQSRMKPLLLLPQAKEISTQPPLQALTKPALDELLIGVDLETLKLRPARKIASALGLAQKVNRRDLPLEWLRAQIKKRLEQTPHETAQVIAEVLKAS